MLYRTGLTSVDIGGRERAGQDFCSDSSGTVESGAPASGDGRGSDRTDSGAALATDQVERLSGAWMTETTSSLLGWRTASGKSVESTGSPELGEATTSVTSSDTSSSISVVSVPFEVTGDGPTMSLGLKRLMPLVDARCAERGLREANGGEETGRSGDLRPSASAMFGSRSKAKCWPVDDSGAPSAMRRGEGAVSRERGGCRG